IHAREQLRHRRPLRDPCAAIGTCGAGGKMQHGLAESLAGDSAGGEAGSTDGISSLDESHAPAQLRRLNGAALTCRTTANADEIVVEGICHWLSKLQPTGLVGHARARASPRSA